MTRIKTTDIKRQLRIRIATPEDAARLVAIYAPYVEQTAITFEYEVPSVEEFAGRIEHILEKYPYLVAEAEGEIVGYAYAGTFKARAAYDWSVETTIYVNQKKKRMGIGGKLYAALEEALRAQHILNLNACIGYPQNEDEYLTKDSEKFHQKLGYRLVGTFHDSGYKFGRWYDMIWMEKMLGEHTETGIRPNRLCVWWRTEHRIPYTENKRIEEKRIGYAGKTDRIL